MIGWEKLFPLPLKKHIWFEKFKNGSTGQTVLLAQWKRKGHTHYHQTTPDNTWTQLHLNNKFYSKTKKPNDSTHPVWNRVFNYSIHIQELSTDWNVFYSHEYLYSNQKIPQLGSMCMSLRSHLYKPVILSYLTYLGDVPIMFCMNNFSWIRNWWFLHL